MPFDDMHLSQFTPLQRIGADTGGIADLQGDSTAAGVAPHSYACQRPVFVQGAVNCLTASLGITVEILSDHADKTNGNAFDRFLRRREKFRSVIEIQTLSGRVHVRPSIYCAGNMAHFIKDLPARVILTLPHIADNRGLDACPNKRIKL